MQTKLFIYTRKMNRLVIDMKRKNLFFSYMYNAKDRLPMVHILVFYTGERPWNAANKLSQLIKSKSSRH